MVLTATAF